MFLYQKLPTFCGNEGNPDPPSDDFFRNFFCGFPGYRKKCKLVCERLPIRVVQKMSR